MRDIQYIPSCLPYVCLQAIEREGKLQEIAAKAEGLSDAALLFQRKSRA